MRPRTSTCVPARGVKPTSEFCARNIAQRSCASRSLREKYQWPEAGCERFDSSPSTQAPLDSTIAQEVGVGIIHRSMSIAAQAREVGRVKKFESCVISDPITVPPTMTIREVLDLTRSRGISGVPVVVGRKAVGIV